MNKQDYPLIFELSKPGRIGFSLPELMFLKSIWKRYFLKRIFVKKSQNLPEVSELDIMRHYTALSNETMVLILDFIHLVHVR